MGIKLEPYATPEGAGKEFLNPDSDGLTHGFGFRDCGGRVGYMLYTVQGEGFGHWISGRVLQVITIRFYILGVYRRNGGCLPS